MKYFYWNTEYVRMLKAVLIFYFTYGSKLFTSETHLVLLMPSTR